MGRREVLLFIISFFALITHGRAQDSLYLRNGTRMCVRILEIQPTFFLYRPCGDTSSNKLYMARQDVKYYMHVNSAGDTMRVTLGTGVPGNVPMMPGPAQPGVADLRILARQDAARYYRHDRPYWAAFITTALFAPLGAAVYAVTSVVPPREKNLSMPVLPYSGEPEYKRAYRKGASAIKRKRVLNAFLAGAAIQFVGFIFYLELKNGL